jgi:beta-glucanase (GH16 family)
MSISYLCWAARRMVAFLAASLSLAPVSGQAVQPKPLDLSGYTMTLDEEFTKLDASPYGPGTRWICHTPWNGDFGDAAFDNPGPDGPFSTSDKGLTITASKDANGKWHSGLLCSRSPQGVGPKGFAQAYGYFEMRAKLPDGPGVWPAFWLVGADNSPIGPELDVIEYYGDFPWAYHTTVHVWQNHAEQMHAGYVENVPSGLLTRQFNTFGVLIDKDETTFFLNRIPYWQTPTLPAFRQPMAVIVNLALGGGWSIKKLTSPQRMEVQYVRVYQKR